MFKYIHNAILTASILILTATSVFSVAKGPIGVLEGAIFPVVDPALTIISYENLGGGETKLAGYAGKVRNCNYILDSLEWYYGTEERNVGVSAYFEDPPAINSVGQLEWKAIIVGLSEKRIRENSYATVKHDCGFPWLTTSLFYISENGASNGR